VKGGGHRRADSDNNGETDDEGVEQKGGAEKRKLEEKENMKCAECSQFGAKSGPFQWLHMWSTKEAF